MSGSPVRVVPNAPVQANSGRGSTDGKSRASFAEQMTAVFELDLRDATAFSHAMWQARPLRERIAETLILPIKSQL